MQFTIHIFKAILELWRKHFYSLSHHKTTHFCRANICPKKTAATESEVHLADCLTLQSRRPSFSGSVISRFPCSNTSLEYKDGYSFVNYASVKVFSDIETAVTLISRVKEQSMFRTTKPGVS